MRLERWVDQTNIKFRFTTWNIGPMTGRGRKRLWRLWREDRWMWLASKRQDGRDRVRRNWEVDKTVLYRRDQRKEWSGSQHEVLVSLLQYPVTGEDQNKFGCEFSPDSHMPSSCPNWITWMCCMTFLQPTGQVTMSAEHSHTHILLCPHVVTCHNFPLSTALVAWEVSHSVVTLTYTVIHDDSPPCIKDMLYITTHNKTLITEDCAAGCTMTRKQPGRGLLWSDTLTVNNRPIFK